MAWDYFADGKRIGGLTILDLLLPTQSKDSTLYRVACRKCGTAHEMRHRQIMNRATKGRDSCMGCRYETPSIPDEPEGVRDLRGQFWPRLKGPMGPRWGGGNGPNRAAIK